MSSARKYLDLVSTMDESLPKGGIEEHLKRCRAKKRCPFTKDAMVKSMVSVVQGFVPGIRVRSVSREEAAEIADVLTDFRYQAAMAATGNILVADGETPDDLKRKILQAEVVDVPDFESLPRDVKNAYEKWVPDGKIRDRKLLARSIVKNIGKDDLVVRSRNGAKVECTINGISEILGHCGKNDTVAKRAVCQCLALGGIVKQGVPFYEEEKNGQKFLNIANKSKAGDVEVVTLKQSRPGRYEFVYHSATKIEGAGRTNVGPQSNTLIYTTSASTVRIIAQGLLSGQWASEMDYPQF